MATMNATKGSNSKEYDSFTLSLEEDVCFDDLIDLLDDDNSLECNESLCSSSTEGHMIKVIFTPDDAESFSTADNIERIRKKKRKMGENVSSALMKRSQSPTLTEKSFVTESSCGYSDVDGIRASSCQTVPAISLMQFDFELELSAIRLSQSIKRSRISRSRVLMFQEPYDASRRKNGVIGHYPI